MSVLTFYRMHPAALLPLAADKSALGMMPLAAFQYCEPMRTAAGYGYWIFPPLEIDLRFNGTDVQYLTPGGWVALQEAYLPGYRELWDRSCPEGFVGFVPPYLRLVSGVRGAVQIWSGLLVRSEPGWSINVRGIPNVFQTSHYSHYEAIVETDKFAPCPLFTNIQLLSTDLAIKIPHHYPLFQVQPIQQTSYWQEERDFEVKEAFGRQVDAGTADSTAVLMTAEDWAGFRRTIVADDPSETHRLGDYARDSRRRSKSAGNVD